MPLSREFTITLPVSTDGNPWAQLSGPLEILFPVEDVAAPLESVVPCSEGLSIYSGAEIDSVGVRSYFHYNADPVETSIFDLGRPILVRQNPKIDPESVEDGYFPTQERARDLVREWEKVAQIRTGRQQQKADRKDVTALAKETLRNLQRQQKIARALITDDATNPVLGGEYLRNQLFKRLRDVDAGKTDLAEIYSAAIPLPMSYWNTAISKTAASTMKELLFRLARAFFAASETAVDFQKQISVDHLCELEDSDITGIGQVTVVNKTLIAIQQADHTQLVDFLEHLPDLMEAALRLICQADANLNSGTMSSLTTIPAWEVAAPQDQNLKKWRAISTLANEFRINAQDGIQFIIRDENGLETGEADLHRFALDRLVVGLAAYKGEEDAPQKFNPKTGKMELVNVKEEGRLLSSVYSRVDALRDEAITRAELVFSQLKSRDATSPISGAERIHYGGAIPGPLRLFWREGRYLTRRQIGLRLVEMYRQAEMQSKMTMQELQLQYRPVGLEGMTGFMTALALQDARLTGGDEKNAPRRARAWMDLLEDVVRGEADASVLKDLVDAARRCFREGVPDARVRALYWELGGNIDPLREIRAFTNSRGEESLGQRLTNLLGPRRSRAELATQARAIATELHQLNRIYARAAYDPQNGLTLRRRIFASMVQRDAHTYYDRLEQSGVTLEGDSAPEVLYIGFEAKNAKTVDAEGHPLTPQDLMDKNLGPMKTVPTRALQGFRRMLWNQSTGAILADEEEGAESTLQKNYLPIHVYALGDEIVIAMPRHRPDGLLFGDADLQAMAREIRKQLKLEIPYIVHYETKIELEKTVLRPKLYALSLSGGQSVMVASAAGAFDGDKPDEPVWVLEDETGHALKKPVLKSRRDFASYSVAPLRGQIDCRLLTMSVPLSSRLTRAYLGENLMLAEREALLRGADTVIELDEPLKAFAKAHGLIAESGIFIHVGGETLFRAATVPG